MATQNLLICGALPRQGSLQTHAALKYPVGTFRGPAWRTYLLRAERKGFDPGGLQSSDTESTVLESYVGLSEQTSALQGFSVLR